MRANYIGQPQAEASEKFFDAVAEAAKPASGGTFDSAAASDFLSNARSLSTSVTGIEMPVAMDAILESLPAESHGGFTKAVMDGIAAYEDLHGVKPTGDVLNAALNQAFAVTDKGLKLYHLDDASTDHHDQLSLQPNRAAIAVIAAISEAIPVANYLPTDIGSNEARLIIVTHQAGQHWADFAYGDLMDGTASGHQYVASARTIDLTDAAGTWSGQFREYNLANQPNTPDPAAPVVGVLSGRAIIYVNGLVAATEIAAPKTGSSAIAGTITVNGTSYTVGGAITPTTGAIAITFTPALPVGVTVQCEDFVDFETQPELIPSVITDAQTFKLYASPFKVVAQQTIDSKGQFANELGLDPQAEAMLAVRNQVANERHYNVLRKAKMIGQAKQVTYDFAWGVMGAQKTRAQVWQDFSALLGQESQKMANDTFDHGITHLYVNDIVMANIIALPRELFEPSGLSDRPGIYRIGRLFGKYEVYYTPRGLNQSATTAEILAIGRSSQVARNPFVLGDAVPPTVVQLGVTRDMKGGFGFYSRQFTSVNPHQRSAVGGGVLINVINLA